MTNEKILHAADMLNVAKHCIENASLALLNLPDHREYVIELREKVADVTAMLLMDAHRSTEDILAGIAKIKEQP